MKHFFYTAVIIATFLAGAHSEAKASYAQSSHYYYGAPAQSRSFMGPIRPSMVDHRQLMSQHPEAYTQDSTSRAR